MPVEQGYGVGAMASKKDNEKGSEDGPTFSYDAIIAFNSRMQSDPEAVSDSDIQEQYGTDISADEVRKLFRKNTFKRAPVELRASARAKLRRRLSWLSRTLEEVESAVEEVRCAPGRTNKQDELDTLLTAIDVFRASIKLPKPKEPAQADPDLIERLLGIGNDDPGQPA